MWISPHFIVLFNLLWVCGRALNDSKHGALNVEGVYSSYQEIQVQRLNETKGMMEEVSTTFLVHWGAQGWVMEILFVCALVLVCLQMKQGSRRNHEQAQQWAKVADSTLRPVFPQAGFSNKLLQCYGWSHYEYFASGNAHCLYMLIELHMFPRQCFWRNLAGQMMGRCDALTLEVAIPSTESLSLVLGRRFRAKALREQYPHLTNLLSLRKSSALPPGLCLLEDGKNVGEHILNICPSVIRVMELGCQQYLDHLVVSDLIQSSRFPCFSEKCLVLRMVCSMMSLNDTRVFLESLMELVKVLATIRLGEKVKESIRKLRGIVQKEEHQDGSMEKNSHGPQTSMKRKKRKDMLARGMTEPFIEKSERVAFEEMKSRGTSGPFPSEGVHHSADKDSAFFHTPHTRLEQLYKTFEHELNEKSSVVPSCLFSICPEEMKRYRHLEKIDTAMNEAITRQQRLLHEAWTLFNDDQEASPASGARPPGGISPSIFRLHIYNTYFHQKSANPELDSFVTTNWSEMSPPRWVLRIQGHLLDSRHQDVTCVRMTSLFDRIMVSRSNETLIWDRRYQAAQPTVEKTFKEVFPHYQPLAKKMHIKDGYPESLELCKDEQNSNPPPLKDFTHTDHANGQGDHVDGERERETYAIMDATLSDSVVHHLVDCDGIELCRVGDVEEDITIVLFPHYPPHYSTLSPELASVVGFPVGSLAQVLYAFWQRVGNVARHSADLSCLPCDTTLQRLFDTTRTTFSFYELPQLLSRHLQPATPMVFKHRIMLTGDYVDNETIYDIHIDPSHLAHCFESWTGGASETLGVKKEKEKKQQVGASKALENEGRDEEGAENLGSLFLEFLQQPINDQDGEARFEDGFKLRLELQECWNEILGSVARRTLLDRFAKNPPAAMHMWLTKPCGDSPQSFLEQYELGDTRHDFYSQPWVESAVKSYLDHNKESFDGLIKETLLVSDPEQWSSAWPTSGAKPSEGGFGSRAPATWGEPEESQKALDGTVRVPMFTQISRPTHDDRYAAGDMLQRYPVGFSPYPPYLKEACSMSLQLFNSLSVYQNAPGYGGTLGHVPFSGSPNVGGSNAKGPQTMPKSAPAPAKPVQPSTRPGESTHRSGSPSSAGASMDTSSSVSRASPFTAF